MVSIYIFFNIGAALNIIMAAADDTLREFIFPYMGIERTKSDFFLNNSETPSPSLPITMQVGASNFV